MEGRGGFLSDSPVDLQPRERLVLLRSIKAQVWGRLEWRRGRRGRRRGRVEGMTCRRIPKSGRTADDVLKLVGLSTDDIVAQAKSLT